MKRIALILSVLCLVAVESWSGNASKQIPIILVGAPQENKLIHHAPYNPPMRAYYEELISAVCMTFSQNLGELEITITNLNNGSSTDFEVDSSAGSVVLPIAGNDGIYNILITTTGGTQYSGEFEII